MILPFLSNKNQKIENMRFPWEKQPKQMNHIRAFLLLVVTFSLSSIATSQCFVQDYSSNRKVLKVDGDYVLNYSNNTKLYKFDGDYIVDYKNYKKMLKMDGDYVVRYSDNKKIGKWDGSYLIDYSTNRKIAKLDCPGKRSVLAAAAYFLL